MIENDESANGAEKGSVYCADFGDNMLEWLDDNNHPINHHHSKSTYIELFPPDTQELVPHTPVLPST